MKNFRKNSVKGFVWNHLARLSDYGFTYLISVVLARNLESLSYSLFVTTFSIGSVLIILSSLGIDETLNRFISQISSNQDKGKVKYLLISLLKYRLVALLIFSVLVFFLRFDLAVLFGNENLSFYLSIIVFYVLFQNLNNFAMYYFTSILNTKTIFYVTTFSKLISFFLISLYLTVGKDLVPVFIILAFISLGSFISYIFFSKDLFKISSSNFDISEVKKFFPVMWLNGILSMVLGRYSDIFLLGALLGITAEVGNYEVAFSLSTAIDYLFSVGLIGVVVSIFSTIATSEKSRIVSVRNKIIKYYQLIVLPIMLFSFIFAHELVEVIYSERYKNSIILFQVLLIYKIIAVNFLGSGLNISILVSIGKQKDVLITRIVLGFVNIIINYIVIPIYGALGAIFTTGAIMFLIYLIDFILVSRYVEFKYDFINLIKNLFIIIPWLVSLYVFNIYLDLSIILLIFVFVTGLFALYLFFNKPLLADLQQSISIFISKE